MKGFPSSRTVEMLRSRYPEGCRVELVCMNDPYTRLKPGDQGEVAFVDDIGTIHVRVEQRFQPRSGLWRRRN